MSQIILVCVDKSISTSIAEYIKDFFANKQVFLSIDDIDTLLKEKISLSATSVEDFTVRYGSKAYEQLLSQTVTESSADIIVAPYSYSTIAQATQKQAESKCFYYHLDEKTSYDLCFPDKSQTVNLGPVRAIWKKMYIERTNWYSQNTHKIDISNLDIASLAKEAIEFLSK